MSESNNEQSLNYSQLRRRRIAPSRAVPPIILSAISINMKINSPVVILIIALINAIYGCSPKYDNTAMFRGNLERTGVYDTNSKIPLGEIKWKYKTGTDYLSSPIVSQGVVYVSGTGGYFVAVDANTGEKSWEFKREKWGGSSPSVSNGTVFIGSMDYFVYAIDIKTETEKWKFKTDEYIFSSPAVSNGYVYFGNFNGYFYSVSANTGQEKWKFKTQGSEPPSKAAGDYDIKGAIRSSPAIFKNIVYFGSFDGYLYALALNSGQEKWKFKTGGVIAANPAITDNVIYFGSYDGYLYAVDDNGQEKWKFNTNDFLTVPSQATQTRLRWISPPTIANEFVYFSVSYQWSEHSYDDGSDNRLNYLFAVDTETGQIKWKIQTASDTPTVSNNIVYYGDNEGFVFALNAKTGQEIWKFRADSSIVSEVVVIDGVAYFCSKEGYLYALQ